VQVIQHNCLEWLQEHLLVAEVLSLFFLEELVSKLSKRINCVNDNMQVLVRAYPGKVLSEGTPDALPLETYTIHVQRGNLNEFLKAELLWAVFIGQLLFRNPAKIFDEVDDRISVESLAL
jgi:hypothetical protein